MDAERFHSPYEDVPTVEETQSRAAAETIPADGPWVTSVDSQGRTIVTIDTERMMNLADPVPAHIRNGSGNVHTRVLAVLGLDHEEEFDEPNGQWGAEARYEHVLSQLVRQ